MRGKTGSDKRIYMLFACEIHYSWSAALRIYSWTLSDFFLINQQGATCWHQALRTQRRRDVVESAAFIWGNPGLTKLMATEVILPIETYSETSLEQSFWGPLIPVQTKFRD